MSTPTKVESARMAGAKSRAPKTSQDRTTSPTKTTRPSLTGRTLILQNQSQAQFLGILNTPAGVHAFLVITAKAVRHNIQLTRTNRKAVDNFRRQRVRNILNKNPVLQNEPKAPELSALNTTPNANGDFHRTHGSQDSPLGMHSQFFKLHAALVGQALLPVTLPASRIFAAPPRP